MFCICVKKEKGLSAVELEPTSANTVELESTPLDRSGTLTTISMTTRCYNYTLTLEQTKNHTLDKQYSRLFHGTAH